jgi:hypothetical protein
MTGKAVSPRRAAVAVTVSGDDPAARVSDMSQQDFARLGLNHIAYVRAVGADDTEDAGWAIHAANGQRIGTAPTPEQAFAATRQHDMEPMNVH